MSRKHVQDDEILWNTKLEYGVNKETRYDNLNFTKSSLLVRCSKKYAQDVQSGRQPGKIKFILGLGDVASMLWQSQKLVDNITNHMQFRCFDHLCWTSEEDPSSYSVKPYNLPWCLEDLSMVFSEDNVAVLCWNETYPIVQRYYAPQQSYLESEQKFSLIIQDFSEECVTRIKQRSSDWLELKDEDIALRLDLGSNDLLINWLRDNDGDILTIQLTDDDNQKFEVELTYQTGELRVSLKSSEQCNGDTATRNFTLSETAIDIGISFLSPNLTIAVRGSNETVEGCGPSNATNLQLKITDSTARNTSLISNVNYKTVPRTTFYNNPNTTAPTEAVANVGLIFIGVFLAVIAVAVTISTYVGYKLWSKNTDKSVNVEHGSHSPAQSKEKEPELSGKPEKDTNTADGEGVVVSNPNAEKDNNTADGEGVVVSNPNAENNNIPADDEGVVVSNPNAENDDIPADDEGVAVSNPSVERLI